MRKIFYRDEREVDSEHEQRRAESLQPGGGIFLHYH